MENTKLRDAWLYFTFIVVILLCVNGSAQNFLEPSQIEWSQFVQMIKKSTTLTLFGKAVLAVQFIYFILRTALGDILGIHKIFILSFLSIVVTIGLKLLSGESLIWSLFDAPTIFAYQVCVHQIMIQWRNRHNDRKRRAKKDKPLPLPTDLTSSY